MKIRLLVFALAALVFWGCGSSSKVTQTGTQEEEVSTPDVKGSETSTGLCKTFESKAEEKKVLAAYSLYRESFKQENFEDAMTHWKQLMELAPGFRKKPFVDGEAMYKHYYENASSDAEKAKFKTLLYDLYDERIKCHGEEGKVLETKGKFILANIEGKEDEAYSLFEEAMTKSGNNTGYSVLKALLNKYRSDIRDEVTTEEAVMPMVDKMKKIAQHNIDNGVDVDKYKETLEALNSPLKAQVIKTTRTETVKKGIEFADCNEAVAHYEAQLAESPGDEKVLGNYYARLTKMKCTTSPQYIKILEQYNSLNPSASKLYKIGNYHRKAENYDKAIDIYKQAVDMAAADDPSLSGTLYALANTYYKKGQYSNARNAAEKAAKAKPGWGAPWLLIGGLYAKSYKDCGTNEVERAGAIWAAVDAYAKAKADPKSASDAQDRINNMYKYYPEKGQLFMASVAEGDAYKVECWIQRNTTVRVKKQ